MEILDLVLKAPELIGVLGGLIQSNPVETVGTLAVVGIEATLIKKFGIKKLIRENVKLVLVAIKKLFIGKLAVLYKPVFWVLNEIGKAIDEGINDTEVEYK